jgi:hypothetical protein
MSKIYQGCVQGGSKFWLLEQCSKTYVNYQCAIIICPVLTKGNVELNWIWVRFSEASKIGEFEPFMPS